MNIKELRLALGRSLKLLNEDINNNFISIEEKIKMNKIALRLVYHLFNELNIKVNKEE